MNEDSKERELDRIKIKTSLEYLYETIETVNVFSNKKNVHYAIGQLYDVATGSPFESADEDQKRAATKKIAEICTCAAIAKRVIYLEVLGRLFFW